MATYNGASYISEQLESLSSQSHLPTELVIGDDGSTDGSLDIIEKFAKNAPFTVHVQRNERNLGYARNFLETAKRCGGDWVAFCDQDDVWLPTKLRDSARAIERMPGCTMVLQKAWLCDRDLKSRGRVIPNRFTAGVRGRRCQFGFWNWPGFIKTISKPVIDLQEEIENFPRSWNPLESELTHDKWTCLITNALGGINVLTEPVALYRRHADALTGNKSYPSLAKKIKKSTTVSSDYYEFRRNVAFECAEYMEKLSDRTDDSNWSDAFEKSAQAFRRLSKIQGLRAELYHADQLGGRLAAFWKILQGGGYFGSPFYAMSYESAAKDALRVISG